MPIFILILLFYHYVPCSIYWEISVPHVHARVLPTWYVYVHASQGNEVELACSYRSMEYAEENNLYASDLNS